MCNKSDANKLKNRKVASFYSKLMTALNLISCVSYPGSCAGTAKFSGIHSSLEKSVEHCLLYLLDMKHYTMACSVLHLLLQMPMFNP